MKKLKFLLTLLLGFLMTATSLFAGSLDYLSNQSARFMMVPSRNAAIDHADIVAYNPAGAALMSPGFHLDFSSQTLLKLYGERVTVTGATLLPAANTSRELEQSTPTPSLPNLYLVYNFGEMGPGKLAAYFEIGVTAGGGDLEWKNGTAGTTFALTAVGIGANSAVTTQTFNATSIYATSGLGVAYSFLDDMISVSLGGRAVYSMRGFELEAGLANGAGVQTKYDYNALGVTPVLGIDVRPIKGLTLGLRYEHETELEFEYEQKKLTGTLATAGATVLNSAGIVDGKKFKQNLPQIIGIGAEYQVTDKLLASVSGTIYMLSQSNLEGTEDFLSTGWEIGTGIKYNVKPELQFGIGVLYTEAGAKKSYLNSNATMLNASANPLLDSISAGFGGTYAPVELGSDIDFTVAIYYAHYLPENYSVTAPAAQGGYTVAGEYKKDVIGLSFGVGYNM